MQLAREMKRPPRDIANDVAAALTADELIAPTRDVEVEIR